jgi:hypothetical protein
MRNTLEGVGQDASQINRFGLEVNQHKNDPGIVLTSTPRLAHI